MKKIFTSLAALALSAATAGAQGTGRVMDVAAGAVEACPQAGSVQALGTAMDRSSQRRIAMEEDERLVGYYTTDDLPDVTKGGYVGLSHSGTWRVGAVFDGDVLKNVVGAEFTKLRFALALQIDVPCAFIYAVDKDYVVAETPLAEIDLTGRETVLGWNDVELEAPIPIEEGVYYLVGFEYVEKIGVEYPLVTDKELDVDVNPDYGFVGFGTISGVQGWYSFSGGGNLCVQAVAKGGGSVDYDVVLKGLDASMYAQKDGQVDFTLSAKSEGRYIPDSYALKMFIDGEEKGTLESPVRLSTSFQTVSGAADLGSLECGNHSLTVYLSEINGETPTECTENDTLQCEFTIFDGSVARQMNVIENFTSVNCTWCPRGHAVLEAMQDLYPGKWAWVALHYNMDGNDPYYQKNGKMDYIFEYAGCSSYPSAAFNRSLITDTELGVKDKMTISISYADSEAAATIINDAIDRIYEDRPAMVTVDISTDYDEETGELYIKVTGDGGATARQMLEDNILTVYVTEDSLVYRQLNEGTYVEDYVHNNVFRGYASAAWGDDINWTSDSSYENDIVVTIDEDWNLKNLNLVAFISGPMLSNDHKNPYMDRELGFVDNANMVKLRNGPTGIANTVSADRTVETARFTIDGRPVSTPVRGVNIVRMSDGSTRKVIVK